ncbi:hypothetical protein GCM10022384_41280 [Streptomyces marokkonensis]|uniref:Secreted protein n=1 Tax=Streptomyces marokkonensis TaxID=324855 RepID=A0ABP7QWT5_9ACTN
MGMGMGMGVVLVWRGVVLVWRVRSMLGTPARHRLLKRWSPCAHLCSTAAAEGAGATNSPPLVGGRSW